MTKIRLLLFLVPLAAATCFAQCNPHPLRPNLLAPCPTIAGQVSKAMDASKDFKQNVGVMNTGISAARANYWRLYPNRPGLAQAESTFLNALQDKDLYYLMFSLPEGTTGNLATMPNLMDLNPSTTRDSLSSFPKNMDGGIPQFAFPLFVAWVDALRRNTGREHDGDMAPPLLIATAMQDKSNYRQAYEQARNWAEFTTSGLDLSKSIDPKTYILSQMEEGVARVLTIPKPPDIADPSVATKNLYNQLVNLFGERAVLAAAATVLHKPRSPVGGLATPAPVTIGTYVSNTYNPFVFFLSEVTNSSPHNYAVALSTDRNVLLGGQSTVAFNTQSYWEDAASTYSKVVARYGEKNVLAAAARLKDLPKDDNGLRGDQDAKGTIWWFLTLLKDPNAQLPGLYSLKVGSYDPRWMGKMIEARGTVSRVEIEQTNIPHWVTIHFKESPTDKLTAYTPAAAEWQQRFGPGLQSLVGKPIVVYGVVEDWRRGAGVRIYDNVGIKIISASEFASIHDSTPAWLTAPSSLAMASAESPKYHGWKKYPPGTTAAYDEFLLMETGHNTNQFTRTKLAHIVFKLESIDADSAVVTCDFTNYHFNGGPPSQSSKKFYYKAREAAETNPPNIQSTTGQEQLNIDGKVIATTWESHGPASDPTTFYKTWTSDEIPGGLAKESSQQGAYDRRNINLTVWDPAPSAESQVNQAASTQSTAPAAQPSATPPASPSSSPHRRRK